MKACTRRLLFLVIACFLWLATFATLAGAQERSSSQPSSQSTQTSDVNDKVQPQNPSPNSSGADTTRQPDSTSSEPAHHGIAGELARETREAEGDEEHSDLKHSAMVQKLAKITGLSVHQAHLLALGINFAIIVFIVFWFGRKNIPGILRSRNESIQKALEEARAASQEAGRRLSDIENRLRQMDGEISSMQTAAARDAEAEESRIQKAAEEELRKVVQSAEQEITAAAKLARRELSTHTADLAIALARKQINVDSNTDQVLVRDFAAKLATKPASQGGNGNEGGGKGGR